MRSRALAAFVGAVMTTGLLGATIAPQQTASAAGPQTVKYDLNPVPHNPNKDGGSNAQGKATITRDGDQITVKIKARGLSPRLVHVQHIHGIGENECPTAEARDRRIDDGLIDTVEGLPEYGAIQVSLTTTGDTSAASGLAVDRFLTANKQGKLRYERTFTVGVDFPAEVANNLDEHHVVIHGIDVNSNRAYDFDAGTSALDSNLPLEADLPATCGLMDHRH